ncbi:MAG: long-chain fatty acid--CoA ligase [Deinococcales bacterium]
MAVTVVKPPPDSGQVALGRTLPSLLDEAVERRPNPRALNQRGPRGWEPLSSVDFRHRAEALALGLRGRGLEPGDRVAFFTHSDVSFVLGDMACLLAGLVTVPIYLTHAEGAIRHILGESGARALLVSDPELLDRLGDLLPDAEALELVALWGGEAPGGKTGRLRVTTFGTLEAEGAQVAEGDPGAVRSLRDAVTADDVATLIYTSGTTGLPKGVILTHENLSSNVVAAFTGLTTYHPGPDEVVLSFLPLTHIFARTLQYGVMWYGSSVYYGDPSRVSEDLPEVRPTFFASVPRVLALARARAYDVEHPPTGVAAWPHELADRLVYSRWREALGGRLRTVIVGGAALRAELATVFKAAGVDVLQGYGLTETSPVITYNRPDRNRPGTVGVPLAGTEVGITDEGEVLARGPHVMKGYYRRDDLTAEVLDADGWFHTGDLGAVDEDGFVRITGRLKHLFKLSTGKYVMPQPIEQRLEASPLIDTALVVGEGEKYCTALLFVARPALAEAIGRAVEPWVLARADVQGHYRDLVAAANSDMPHWSTVKRFALVLDELTMESGHVTPKLSVKREVVLRAYRGVIEALYRGGRPPEGVAVVEV